MFNYREFKKDMREKGHDVHKKGNTITVTPNVFNHGTFLKFESAEDLIKGYTEYLRLTYMEHYNNKIYEAIFKIK